MIRTVSYEALGQHRMPGVVIRDHFRKVPENVGGPHYCLGPLRTLAEATIEPGSGFPMHAHAEMEIISYVCEGELVHADTLGRSGRLGAGDVQAMTTGTGLRHSEMNGGERPARMYQVWIEPDEAGLEPCYVDRLRPKGGVTGTLTVLASGMATRPGGAPIRVDAAILGADLETGDAVAYDIAPRRHTYVVAARGRLSLNGTELAERHGALVDDVERLTITALEPSDVLILDLPHR